MSYLAAYGTLFTMAIVLAIIAVIAAGAFLYVIADVPHRINVWWHTGHDGHSTPA